MSVFRTLSLKRLIETFRFHLAAYKDKRAHIQTQTATETITNVRAKRQTTYAHPRTEITGCEREGGDGIYLNMFISQ